MTAHDDPILVERALLTGALGYVLKDTAGDDLVGAVRAAHGGHRYGSRSLRGPSCV